MWNRIRELGRHVCVRARTGRRVPWAEPGSGFSALYEALVIDWLKEASIQAVSRQLSLSWNMIDGIMQRAVKRGLARRRVDAPKHIGVDEIAFDKFHVAKYLNEAVDRVRRQEHKALMSEGWEDLKGTKYDWLTNLRNLSRKRQCEFKVLREHVENGAAWAIKDLVMHLWNYISRTWAEKRWKQWYAWAIRSRLEPVRKVAKTIKEHLWGIINVILLKVSNGASESINSRINMIKIRSRGFRNKSRYKNAIYFHLGGLAALPGRRCQMNFTHTI